MKPHSPSKHLTIKNQWNTNAPSPPHAQDKCSIKIHERLEKSIHCGTLWVGQDFTYAPMVLPPQTNTYHTELPASIKIKTKTFIKKITIGKIVFQQDPLTPLGTKFIVN